MDEIAKLPEVAECYEVWNGLRDELESYYKDTPRRRLPLSQQKEFRAIKNLVIQEAENLRLGVFTFEDTEMNDEPETVSEVPPQGAEYGEMLAYRQAAALLRYDDVKDYVDGERLSVTLYAAFEDVPKRDLVIAWYAKTDTSGLDQDAMDALQVKLYEYLASQNYKPDEMDILFRGYEGNVGDTCAAIKNDADVDMMIGWSNSENLAEKGGFAEGTDFLENAGDVTVGSKARYIARISDTELCQSVYTWIQSEYGA